MAAEMSLDRNIQFLFLETSGTKSEPQNNKETEAGPPAYEGDEYASQSDAETRC
jgi:hypothetical protein